LLDTFLLKDSKGNLVPVLGMTFEEFEELLKLKRGLAALPPPAYLFDSLAITGSVENELASLQAAATIRAREAGWVRVPLRFDQAVLRQAPTYEGPGEHLLTHDDQEGYVAWLKGQGEGPHVVKLNLTVPVTSLGAESRIDLVLPRATESSLALNVPLAKVTAQLRAGSEGLASAQSAGQQSEIRVLGAAGEMQLSWRAALPGAASAGALLEASGDIRVKIEGGSRLSSEARLVVRNLAGALESFRVRLPAGMELVPATAMGYTVTPIAPAPGAAEADAAPQVVEVKLERPATAPTEIRLLAAARLSAEIAALEPARFEVLSAVQQRGTIDFSVDGDWSLTWIEDNTTRRAEPPTAPASPVAARFEYYRQPCGLKVKVEARPTRISVEPTYVVFVEPQALRLEATLKYRVRGVRAPSVSVMLGQWRFAGVEPESIVDLEALDPSAAPLILPLRGGVTGDFEIRLAAHIPREAGTSDVSFALPQPTGDLISTASVVVVPADNVELVPKAREITGLIASPQPPRINLPPRQQPPLAYRDLGVGRDARFVAQAQLRTRQTTVGAAARVQFSEQAIAVEQRLAYRILYEPQRTFTLQVPRSLLAREDLKVLLGTEVLPPIPVADGDAESSRMARVQVTAPSDRIGPLELSVQYQIPAPRLSPGQTTTVVVPLAIPDDQPDQSTLGQSLAASWSESLQVELAASTRPGEVGPTIETAGRSELRGTSAALLPELRFQVRTSNPERAGTLSVSKLWVQTLLTESARIERAGWRLAAGNGPLRIVLPKDARLDEAKLAIDGQAAEFQREGAMLVLPLPAARGEVVLEAWYSVPITPGPLAGVRRRLDPPTIERAGQCQACYWQVCMPASRHLVSEPAGFTPELAWNWRGYFWERQGTKDQPQLEEWIGTRRQESPPADWNRYLFSALGNPPAMEVVSLPRSVILWSMGIGVLAVGLTLLHVRRARHPSVLLVLAVLLAAAGFSWPSSALLLAQAAAAAIAILLLAMVWRWSVTGQTPYRLPAPLPALSGVEARSTTAPAARSEPPPPTTATAPMVHVPEGQP
jgi:hypothetical protein